MNTLQRRFFPLGSFRKLLCLGIAALFAAAPGTADDTEIYFNNSTNQNNSFVRPNVMFLLDTSRSMEIYTVPNSGGKTRLQVMQEALAQVLDQTNNVNVGLMRFTSPGGAVLFPVSDIDSDATALEGGVTEAVINSSSDDAEDNLGFMSLANGDLDFGLIAPQWVGVRFQDLKIPKGVTITEAYMEFAAEEVDSGAITVNISAEDSDTAQTFTAVDDDIVNRPKTAANVDWAVPNFTIRGEMHRTPDLSAVVQEVVNRGGWCSGNAMAFTMRTILSGTVGSRAMATFESNFDVGGGREFSRFLPRLVVKWDETTIPTGTSSCIVETVSAQVQDGSDDAEERPDGSVFINGTRLDLVRQNGVQTVGVRFQNLVIPQNADILSAHLEFTVKQSHSSSVTLRIEGEDPNNGSAAFVNQTNDVSNRPRTAAQVDWANPPAAAVGAKLISPDISDVVEEMVASPSWSSGGALVFVVTEVAGTGKRAAHTAESELASAPRLVVTYLTQTATGAFTKTVRERLTEQINAIQYQGSTPIVDTLYEAARYFRGEGVDFGDVRGDGDPFFPFDDRVFNRVANPISFTGTGSINPANCLYSSATACAAQSISGNRDYISPISNDCQKNFIVLLSDGQPTVNNAVPNIESMIGGSCVNPTAGGESGRCGTDLVNFLNTEDQVDDATLSGDQTIQTYTIGFNLDGDEQFLKNIANAGGGQFFEASSAADLIDAFQTILTDVLDAPTSFAAPSLSVNAFNRLFNRDVVYFSLFTPSESQAWQGNVKKFRICTDQGNCNPGDVIDKDNNPAIGADFRIKSTAKSFWGNAADGPEVTEGGAGVHIPVPNSRRVFTYTGNADSPNNPVALTTGSAHEVADGNSAITQAMLNAATATERTRVINWMRGVDVQDENGNNDTTDARWAFADPLHSRPVTITYGALPCTASDVADSSSACFGAATGDPNPDQPIVKVLVGTNDGALRMINDATGEEEWVFYAPETLGTMKDQMLNATGDHIYGLDGTPSALVIDNNQNGIIEPGSPENDKVYIYIGMRRGGKNVYAFDITPGGVLVNNTVGQVTPKFLWRIRGGPGGTSGYERLGQTWSTPLATSIRTGTGGGVNNDDTKRTHALVMGGGYDDDPLDSGFATTDDDTGNAIYIVDAEDGSRIWWASNTASGADLELADMDYPIPADLALVDSDGDGETDRIYATDTGAQIWRIDLDARIGHNNGNTFGARLATLATAGTASEERRFFYQVDVAEVRDDFFSTEPEYDAVVVGSGYRAHPNNLDVHDHFYVIRDYQVDSRVSATNFPLCNVNGSVQQCANGDPITLADLEDVTDNEIQDGATQQDRDDAANALKNTTGWYIQLKTEDQNGQDVFEGEKVLSGAAIIAGKVFFTTFTPAGPPDPNDPCKAVEGTGRLYTVDLLNGTAEIDIDQNNSLDKSDRVQSVGGGIPSELVPVFLETGLTGLVGSSGGAAAVDPNINLPRQRTFWYQDF